MQRRLIFILVATGLILLALAGWSRQGLRWALGTGDVRGAAAPA